MLRYVAIFLIACLQASVTSQEVAKVDALPMKKFLSLLEVEPVVIEAASRSAILKALEPEVAATTNPDFKRAVEKLKDDKSALTMKDVLPLVEPGKSQAVCALFAKHEHPLLRFLANLLLAGSGDSSAAKEAYSIMHIESPTMHEKQLIKTYCLGLGLDPQKDTPDTIMSHIAAMTSQTPLLKVGDMVPEFAITTVDGKQFNRDTCKGKTVVFNFWASWCGPCLAKLPSQNELLAKYVKDDFLVFYVSLDSDRKQFEESVTKYQLTFSNIFEGKGWGGQLSRSFGVNSVPFLVVVDPSGRIVLAKNDGLAEALSNLGK